MLSLSGFTHPPKEKEKTKSVETEITEAKVSSFYGVIIPGVTINVKTMKVFERHTASNCGYSNFVEASWASMSVLIPEDAYNLSVTTYERFVSGGIPFSMWCYRVVWYT